LWFGSFWKQAHHGLVFDKDFLCENRFAQRRTAMERRKNFHYRVSAPFGTDLSDLIPMGRI
jgi:hypothetical protein